VEYSFDFTDPASVIVRVVVKAATDNAVADLVDQKGVRIASLAAHRSGDGLEIIAPAGTVNWITQRVRVTDGDVVTVLKAPFEFDIEKQHDVHYMNRTFFSPGTRIKDPNQFCEFARSAVGVMDHAGRFYCGVLSVLAYRVSEDPSRHAELGRWLVSKRLALFDVPRDPTNPLWLRWWVSSAQTITCLAIYYKNIDAAISIADEAIAYSRFGYVNHMIYWNMASMMLNQGFLLYKRGRISEAGEIFGQLFDLCENGLRDIFNARNAALVTQHTDCIALIEIGRQAYVCHYVCRSGVMPLESKMIHPMYVDSVYIDFVSAVKRFPEKFRPALAELMNAKKMLNDGLAKLAGKTA
jgi:hypothetical protein